MVLINCGRLSERKKHIIHNKKLFTVAYNSYNNSKSWPPAITRDIPNDNTVTKRQNSANTHTHTHIPSLSMERKLIHILTTCRNQDLGIVKAARIVTLQPR
jgi:hypothetical protein